MDGHKDVLGMYVGQNESAKFWLSILNGLKNRGVQDLSLIHILPVASFINPADIIVYMLL